MPVSRSAEARKAHTRLHAASAVQTATFPPQPQVASNDPSGENCMPCMGRSSPISLDIWLRREAADSDTDLAASMACRTQYTVGIQQAAVTGDCRRGWSRAKYTLCNLRLTVAIQCARQCACLLLPMLHTRIKPQLGLVSSAMSVSMQCMNASVMPAISVLCVYQIPCSKSATQRCQLNLDDSLAFVSTCAVRYLHCCCCCCTDDEPEYC